MKAIVTGLNGTVAPAVAEALRRRSIDVIPWDRNRIEISDPAAIQAFFDHTKPDWFFHIATGPSAWAATAADQCRQRNIPFLFTSTVSVFSEHGTGPYPITAQPNATDDYGRYKIECEKLIRVANDRATIARIGWQIGDGAGSNNMIDYLERTYADHSLIEASDQWLPSCSFLHDTANALCHLLSDHPPGLYHLNGNPGLTFFKIVQGLNELHGNRWKVVQGTQPARDDRMLDDRVSVRPITGRLPPL